MLQEFIAINLSRTKLEASWTSGFGGTIFCDKNKNWQWWCAPMTFWLWRNNLLLNIKNKKMMMMWYPYMCWKMGSYVVCHHTCHRLQMFSSHYKSFNIFGTKQWYTLCYHVFLYSGRILMYIEKANSHIFNVYLFSTKVVQQ